MAVVGLIGYARVLVPLPSSEFGSIISLFQFVINNRRLHPSEDSFLRHLSQGGCQFFKRYTTLDMFYYCTLPSKNMKHISLVLRIDNSRQSAIWTILVYSLAILCRLSYYISEELYFSLSKHTAYFIKSFT